MAYVEESRTRGGSINEHGSALAQEWRRLTRVATGVALLTSPAFFMVLYESDHLGLPLSILITIAAVVLFRGLIEVVVRKMIPGPACTAPRRGSSRTISWLAAATGTGVPVPAAPGPDRLHLPAAAPVPGAVRVRRSERVVLQPVPGPAPDLPAGRPSPAGAGVRAAAAAAVHQRLHPVRAVPVHGGPRRSQLRAGRCELGGQDRRRPGPGGGQGGDHPRDHPLAVGRGVREGRRQARARPAVPGRARNRQDDDFQGDRHQLQLPVRDDPRFRVRADVHGDGRARGAVPRA